MPRSYKPRPLGLEPCSPRSVSELERAAAVLGDTAILGCRLAAELQSRPGNTSLPSDVNGEGWQTFVSLQGMLVAERWLIEFLTGPTLGPTDPQTQEKRKRPGDICVDCFVHDWRLPAGPLADELVQRLGPINTLAAHPTWAHVSSAPRLWTLNRVERCVDGLAMLADAVAGLSPTVAVAFEGRIDSARRSLKI